MPGRIRRTETGESFLTAPQALVTRMRAWAICVAANGPGTLAQLSETEPATDTFVIARQVVSLRGSFPIGKLEVRNPRLR
jgi:hypothetical protein